MNNDLIWRHKEAIAARDAEITALKERVRELETNLNLATDNRWAEWELERGKIKGENLSKELRIRELETEHINKPPQERLVCKGCSLPAETQRLREALEQIARHGIYCSDTAEKDSCDIMQQIAQEALKEAKDETIR